jgi:hypothetical protein
MRTINILILGIFCLAIAINRQYVTADDPPPDCDDQCRIRQYVYYVSIDGSSSHLKYEKPCCHICTEGLCLPDDKTDKHLKTDTFCAVKKGQEKQNKYWAIKSKTVCDFPRPIATSLTVQTDPGDPKNLDDYGVDDVTYCRPPLKRNPNPNPNPGPPNTSTN